MAIPGVSPGLEALAVTVLAQGIKRVRENLIMPRLVNGNIGAEAKLKGDTVTVPVVGRIDAEDVVPGATSPNTNEPPVTNRPLKLSQWKETKFKMTDTDMSSSRRGIVPLAVQSAADGIARAVNQYLLNLTTGFYGFLGTAGTTPFSADFALMGRANELLDEQLAASEDRVGVLTTSAMGNASVLPIFANSNTAASNQTQVSGSIGKKWNINWTSCQQVARHTLVASQDWQVNGANQTGYKLLVDTGGTPPTKGDVFSIAGVQNVEGTRDQTFVVESIAGNEWTISPRLDVAPPDDALIAFKGSHIINPVFNRNAITFISRPLKTEGLGMQGMEKVVVDPETGIVMRLVIQGQWRQTLWAFDCLYGGEVTLPSAGLRIAG